MPNSTTNYSTYYYAVDYIKNYYFGRVINKNDSFVQFKFLHRVGATTYH